ncbi:MAG: PilN domain-containing protein, partial [Deltaproteobacteria bacterium]|nr:PilN domain-containing protein [Deltaproteobacteria bacterium]
MIRINLLPYREEKKKASAQRQIVIGVVSLGLFFLLLILLHLHMSMGVRGLEAEVESARGRLNALTRVTGDLEQVTADKGTLEKKIGIITDLEGGRTDSIHIMDELASRISPQTEWLTSITKKGTRLRVEGVAVNNPAIAQFMKRLEASPYIGTVD